MKLFKCQNCDQLIYFENTRCERCGHALGYLWEQRELSALTLTPSGDWAALADRDRLLKTVERLCKITGHVVDNTQVVD